MLVRRIHHWARLHPDKIAIVHGDVAVGYADFWRGIELMRAALRAADIRAGKIAIVMIEDLHLAWLAVLALRSLGVHTVAVAELDVVPGLDLKDAAYLVVTPAQRTGWTVAYAAVLGVEVVALEPFQPGDVAGIDVPQQDRPAQVYGSHILYTSGTTGDYKKLLFDAAGEDRRNEHRAHVLSFAGHTVHHGLSFGLWSGAGFKQPMAAWHAGGCVVFDQRVDALDRLLAREITDVSLLPPMCKLLLDAQARHGHGVRPQLTVRVMSGFLSLEVAQQIVRAITPRLYITYSATELATVPLQSQFASREDLDWMSAAAGISVEVVDDADAPCPVGTEGYIRIGLTPVDCAQYMDNPQATRRSFRHGCFYSGDRAVQRTDGRVRILGRVADVINMHGQKVAAAPLEQKLQRRLGAEDVCLFVHLNDLGQEELLIAVQAPRPLDPARIDEVRRQFADFASVKIHVLEAFPRTQTGTLKVLRLALKNQITGMA